MDDWATWILVAGLVCAFAWLVLALVFPVFAGPWLTWREYLHFALRVGGLVFAPFSALYGLLWMARGVLGFGRWMLCPC